MYVQPSALLQDSGREGGEKQEQEERNPLPGGTVPEEQSGIYKS